ncbi:Hypothetical predicted protein [Olea europaea subsp. europaea]|uniref:Uncharacterized protein n=2 Tax=Olea europaea subsp. europaea TaxID=158383 RepID=A0A8S0PRT0_OLEEU|nr:Hypothetical predicted protein [Olea europaea subsp. europaea]
MEEYLEQSKSFSSENGDLSDAIRIEDEGGEDEQFYEKIEAPKFVDFTVPDHYCPDDRYWFCLRVGCDQKHEEDMDSEAIYKNFVLRVMAARSPNVKLRRTLNRNASRTPIKCPHSAPPKSSKCTLSSRLAVISSISQKMVNDKSKVVRPLLKPESTPRNKTKPVAAKYLTTPRNKSGLPNSNSFRSVRNPKPTTIEISENRPVAKTLVFHSPKKAIKVKTSVELRMPSTKLCEGMKRLEITSQKKKPFLGYSSKSLKNLDSNRNCKRGLLSGSKKVQRTAGEQLDSVACIKPETKSVRSVKSSKSKGKLSRQCVPKELVKNGPGDLDIDVKSRADDTSTISIGILEDASRTGAHLPNAEERSLEGSTNPISEEPNRQVNDHSNANELNDKLKLGSKNKRRSKDVPDEAEHNPSKGTTHENEPMDSDDKENAVGFGENRGDTHSQKQDGIKILGVQDTSGKIRKVAEAHEILQQDNVAPVLKFQKPKPTTPKPFRLRTDERMMHKEAHLERKIKFQSPRSDSAVSTLAGKTCIKEVNDIRGQERAKAAANATPQRSHVLKNQEPTTPTASPLKNNSIQRLEKFRKMRSPQQQHSIRRQGLYSTKRAIPSCLSPGQKMEVIHETSVVREMPSYLIPGQEMEVIHGTAVRAPNRKKRGNLAGNVRKPVTIGKEPNFHSTHVSRICSRNNLT